MVKRGIVYFLIPFLFLTLALNMGGSCEGEDEDQFPIPGSPASMGTGDAGGEWLGRLNLEHWEWIIEDYPPGYYLRAEGGPVYAKMSMVQSGTSLSAYLGLYIYSGDAEPEESDIRGALQRQDDTDEEEEPEPTIEIFNGVYGVGAYSLSGTTDERSVSLSDGGASLILEYEDMGRTLRGTFYGAIGRNRVVMTRSQVYFYKITSTATTSDSE